MAINFQVDRLIAKHGFYATVNLNINIILDTDYLQESDARIYYDLGALGIKVTYIF